MLVQFCGPYGECARRVRRLNGWVVLQQHLIPDIIMQAPGYNHEPESGLTNLRVSADFPTPVQPRIARAKRS